MAALGWLFLIGLRSVGFGHWRTGTESERGGGFSARSVGDCRDGVFVSEGGFGGSVLGQH